MTKILSDDVFEKVHHSVNMLHSLQNCHDTSVMNREEVDEKLFEELNNCGEFIKHFESMFLQIVNEDLQDISRAAVINPDNFERAEELIGEINKLIENFNIMESGYIAKSESLKSMASQFRTRLVLVKKDMEMRIKQQQKHKNMLNSEIIGHTTAN